ncbi:MAG: VanW family protein [Pseudonocardia sp.]
MAPTDQPAGAAAEPDADGPPDTGTAPSTPAVVEDAVVVEDPERVSGDAGRTGDAAAERPEDAAAERPGDAAAERPEDAAAEQPGDAVAEQPEEPEGEPAGPDAAPADESPATSRPDDSPTVAAELSPGAAAMAAPTVRIRPAAIPVDDGPVEVDVAEAPIPAEDAAPTPAGNIDRFGPVEQVLRRHRAALAVVVALTALLALYVADLVSSEGDIPRGVVVAGIAVGGLPVPEAESVLRGALESRAAGPVVVVAEQLRTELDPAAAGLGIDWAGTLERAAVQPVNPFTRIGALFSDRVVEPVSVVDAERASAALGPFAQLTERPPTEATVRFDGLEPVPVRPADGRRLDVPGAVRQLQRDWLSGSPVSVPLIGVPAASSAVDLRSAIDSVARPAVSAPVVVLGDGLRATLAPEVIASALRFRVAPGGDTLVPEINVEPVIGAVAPQLAPSERPGRNASVSFAGGAPSVVPGQDGRRIDYPATFATLAEVLTRTGGSRELPAVYVSEPAKVTPEELTAVLAAGEISSFTTGGFAADSGQNIRRAAEIVNGAVVGPGETFSLNGLTNPRNASNGFVEAGIIEDGQPARGIGGGVSQIATTLYNAAYFAGMTDVEHREHSYYISRYPVAREATVFDDVIDLKFRNDTPNTVVVQTIWTPSSITAKILGRKIYEVTSTTGPRSNPTQPENVSGSGPNCKASTGAPGFTASDTRTIRELATGQVRTETRRVTYKPSPNVTCGGGGGGGDDRENRDDD